MNSIRIQSPGGVEANLLDTLVGLADGADGGGAFYAFASADGVRLLVADDAFVGAMRRGRFDLVVGMDAITDTAALAALEAIAADQPGFAVAAFLHERSALFHPKLCWLLKGRRVELVVGSGNLTPGGLRKNWEAFAHLTLEGEEARAFLEDIDRWRAEHADWLRQIDDPSVVERARRNALRRAAVRRVAPRAEEGLEEFAPEPQPIDAEVADVLVAEIPRASTRWNQANFDLHNFETFFGARAGAHTRIVLRHVTSLGELEAIESRPGVSVQSHNYRVELAAAAGLPYPDEGRPMGVFLKTAGGIFVYRLVMPDDQPAYAALDRFLANRWTANNRFLRRVRTTIQELRVAWPQSPLWLVDTDAI